METTQRTKSTLQADHKIVTILLVDITSPYEPVYTKSVDPRLVGDFVFIRWLIDAKGVVFRGHQTGHEH